MACHATAIGETKMTTKARAIRKWYISAYLQEAELVRKPSIGPMLSPQHGPKVLLGDIFIKLNCVLSLSSGEQF